MLFIGNKRPLLWSGLSLAGKIKKLFATGANGAWYDPGDFATLFQDVGGVTPVTSVGQTVRKMLDKSGGGSHGINATGWLLAQDAFGRYYLTADGASLFSASIAWSGTNLTLACAFNTLTTPIANEQLIGLGNTANASDFGGLRLQNTTGLIELYASGALGTMTAVGGSQGVPSDPHVFIGQTGAATAYRDLTANTGTGLITSLAAVNVLAIGGLQRSILGAYAGGNFYGALAINRSLSAPERVMVNSYLRNKYAVTGMFLAVGDSHTFNDSLGVVESDFYPRELARLIGDRMLALNFGVSGNTTGNMVARLNKITEAGAPEFAVIYGSTNDSSGITAVQASPAPTTTAFTVNSTFGARYGAGALIQVNGVDAEVLSVAGDRITVTTPLGFTPATGHAVVLRTQANLVKIGQAIQSLGCTRILLCGLHYYNFASGLGDTPTTESINGGSLRVIQIAAASQLGAVYVDFYDWMRDLIVAGTYTQGDDLAWHVAVSNAHLNAVGEQILADALYAAMQSEGWI